jgi:uncharacterized phiE125 gp8 family phage protein
MYIHNIRHEIFASDSPALNLDEVKEYLKIDTDFEDTTLGTLIDAAVLKFEYLSGKILMQRRIDIYTENFAGCVLRFPRKPVIAIEQIETTDGFGNREIFPAELYFLRDNELHFLVFPLAQQMHVQARVGIAPEPNGIPPDIKAALLQHIAFLHENREQDDSTIIREIYRDHKIFEL